MAGVKTFKRTGTFSVCAIWGEALLGPLSLNHYLHYHQHLLLTHYVGGLWPETLREPVPSLGRFSHWLEDTKHYPSNPKFLAYVWHWAQGWGHGINPDHLEASIIQEINNHACHREGKQAQKKACHSA